MDAEPRCTEPQITAAQRRALTVLRDQCDELGGTAQVPFGSTTPGTVARGLWPDSPGWKKRSTRGQGDGAGAFGAGMPMAAARVLWQLARLHLAKVRSDHRWEITTSGRRALETGDPT